MRHAHGRRAQSFFETLTKVRNEISVIRAQILQSFAQLENCERISLGRGKSLPTMPCTLSTQGLATYNCVRVHVRCRVVVQR